MTEPITPNIGFASVGIVVGLPFSGRPTCPLWGVSLASQVYPLNTTVTHCIVNKVEVGQARDMIVEQALLANARYVWFIDDDVVLPPHAAQRLGYALDTRGPEMFPEKNIMVCAGIYMSKEPEVSTPVVYKKNGQGAFWKWKLGEIFEVESAGTGCMMINTEVFKHLEKPYFKTVEEYTQVGEHIGCAKITDDLYFCKKVKDAGFNIIAHGGVICGHYDVKKDFLYELPEDSYPVRAAKAENSAPANEATIPVATS